MRLRSYALLRGVRFRETEHAVGLPGAGWREKGGCPLNRWSFGFTGGKEFRRGRWGRLRNHVAVFNATGLYA